MVQKFYVTYNQVHKLCQQSADAILKEFHPNLMIAIGGGGYVPARILRYVLTRPDSTLRACARKRASNRVSSSSSSSSSNVHLSPGI
jgi:hypoxanthine phosphoribosyltransferase